MNKRVYEAEISRLTGLKMQQMYKYIATDKAKRSKKHFDRKMSAIDQEINEIKALILISRE